MHIRSNYLIRTIILLLVIFAIGEAFARYYLGLGTPPLSVTHARIEYMFKPNQDIYRFGNHYIVNQYGMRTIPFSKEKANGDFRLMVFGDSVLNGGNLTDHAALATTILNDRLSGLNYKNVIVGNISAGSWGPGNWLAYAKEYGFFGADIVALVISSHDYTDNPTFQALSKNTHPTEKPISALLEGITRYLPRYLPQIGNNNNDLTDFDQYQAVIWPLIFGTTMSTLWMSLPWQRSHFSINSCALVRPSSAGLDSCTE